jgi:STE24 endopeptidase
MEIRVDVRENRDAHRRRTLAKGLAAAILVSAWSVAALLLWRTEVPSLSLPRLDPRDFFSAAELARIDDYRRVSRPLFVGAIAAELAAVALCALFAAPLTRAARRLGRGTVRTGICVALLVVLAIWLAQLPLEGASHWWARRHGLTHQGYGGWLADAAVALAIQAVLFGLATAGAMLLARRLGGRWWIVGGPALAAAAVLFFVLQPLVVQPLTNDFRPLANPSLARQVERLAAREGVTVDAVQQTDASRRTTEANAYVAGIGPTRRVVFYDTILDGRFTRGELLSVAAHELGHVGRRHVWKGLAWFALIVIPGAALLAFLTERRGGLADPSLVPLGILVALLIYFGTLPLQNAVSRRYEAEADWIALRATNDPKDFVGLQQQFVRTSLAQPDPPGWVTFWFGTHPGPIDRIAMAKAYEERVSARSPGGS